MPPMDPLPPAPTRRSLLTGSVKLGLGLGAGSLLGKPAVARDWFVGTKAMRVRHAAVGVGGMGGADLEQISGHGAIDVVALCDVDSARLESAGKLFPNARLYRDWREMLAKEDGNIDSVHVTIPDHMHAPVMLEALRRRKHVYGQKPLCRTVAEARAVSAAAARAGTVTQMGIQNHSNANYDAARQLFEAGHIGRVHEVHVWTDRPRNWWPQGVERAEGEDPVPETLDWNLWLGTAPERPYKEKLYHPFSWRGFRDFGTGAQGDMACHLMDPGLWFLELEPPLSVRSDGPVPNDESFPLWTRVHYEFGPTRHTTRGPLLFTWYDGGKAPAAALAELGVEDVPPNKCLFIGEKGALLADPYGPPRLLPEERFADVPIPSGTYVSHWHQWVDACRGVGRASAPFSYAAFLTEVALLGNVALEYPHETLRWDASRMRFPGRSEADRLLSSVPRKF
jgi:predicted dehydrogenase